MPALKARIAAVEARPKRVIWGAFYRTSPVEMRPAERGFSCVGARILVGLWQDQGEAAHRASQITQKQPWHAPVRPKRPAARPRKAANGRSFPWAAAFASGRASWAPRRQACRRSANGYWPAH